jgi:hypothetical protein
VVVLASAATFTSGGSSTSATTIVDATPRVEALGAELFLISLGFAIRLVRARIGKQRPEASPVTQP